VILLRLAEWHDVLTLTEVQLPRSVVLFADRKSILEISAKNIAITVAIFFYKILLLLALLTTKVNSDARRLNVTSTVDTFQVLELFEILLFQFVWHIIIAL